MNIFYGLFTFGLFNYVTPFLYQSGALGTVARFPLRVYGFGGKGAKRVCCRPMLWRTGVAWELLVQLVIRVNLCTEVSTQRARGHLSTSSVKNL